MIINKNNHHHVIFTFHIDTPLRNTSPYHPLRSSSLLFCHPHLVFRCHASHIAGATRQFQSTHLDNRYGEVIGICHGHVK